MQPANAPQQFYTSHADVMTARGALEAQWTCSSPTLLEASKDGCEVILWLTPHGARWFVSPCQHRNTFTEAPIARCTPSLHTGEPSAASGWLALELQGDGDAADGMSPSLADAPTMRASMPSAAAQAPALKLQLEPHSWSALERFLGELDDGGDAVARGSLATVLQHQTRTAHRVLRDVLPSGDVAMLMGAVQTVSASEVVRVQRAGPVVALHMPTRKTLVLDQGPWHWEGIACRAAYAAQDW